MKDEESGKASWMRDLVGENLSTWDILGIISKTKPVFLHDIPSNVMALGCLFELV
jgi:hypothetical protein